MNIPQKQRRNDLIFSVLLTGSLVITLIGMEILLSIFLQGLI
jgi:hypothetical protein